MKYEKKCKVILLKTNDINNIIIKNKENNNLHTSLLRSKNSKIFQNYHLYILAPKDEKLKVGDYFEANNEFHIAKEIYPDVIRYTDFYEENFIFLKKVCRKVICSTNPSLNLPKPSNEFINKYCEEGGIDEIIVEYEEERVCPICTYPIHHIKCPNCECNTIIINYLKVAPDNTITIRKIKDT